MSLGTDNLSEVIMSDADDRHTTDNYWSTRLTRPVSILTNLTI
jgi:hypothetical protein